MVLEQIVFLFWDMAIQYSLWYLPMLVTRYLSCRLNLWADAVTRLNLLRILCTVHNTRSAKHDRFKQSISFHIVSAIKIELQAWADTRENTVLVKWICNPFTDGFCMLLPEKRLKTTETSINFSPFKAESLRVHSVFFSLLYCSFADYWTDASGLERRSLSKAYGIRFVFYVSGQAGQFSIVPFLTNIGAGLALLHVVSCTLFSWFFYFVTIFCTHTAIYLWNLFHCFFGRPHFAATFFYCTWLDLRNNFPIRNSRPPGSSHSRDRRIWGKIFQRNEIIVGHFSVWKRQTFQLLLAVTLCAFMIK